jgi:hypothetical protein
MRAHAGRFHHAPQRFLTPTAARLAGLEHHAKLERLRRERLAGLRQCFQLLLHLAQRAGLRRLALLQPLLIRLQLLLERLHQNLDGLLPLFQIAFGGCLKSAERLFGQAQKFRRALLQRLGAQSAKRLTQISQRLFLRDLRLRQRFLVNRALIRHQFFRGSPAGLRRCPRRVRTG